MTPEILSSLISAIIGGVLVATINALFVRKKTEAETEKLRAETEKIRAETAKLSSDIQKLNTTMDESAYYRPLEQREQVIFDSEQGIDQFDLDGFGATLSTDETKQVGKGKLSFAQGSAVIERFDTYGGFCLTVRKYIYEKSVYDYLPKNPLANGQRKIRFSCQAKVSKGESALFIALTETDNIGNNLDAKHFSVNQNDWQNIDLYFRIRADMNCRLQIVQISISEINTLVLRNLVLAERIN